MANANNEATRLSLTELRTRLQGQPGAAPAEEDPVVPPPIPQRRPTSPPAAQRLSEIEAAAARFAGTPLPESVPNLPLRHRAEVEAAPSFHENGAVGVADDEVAQLRAENQELLAMLAELRQILEEASAAEQTWQQKEQEYQTHVDELAEHLRQIEEQLSTAPPPP